MDRADNRIARCRTLLCAPPILFTIVILTIVIFTIVIFTIVIFTIVILSVAKDLLFGIVFSMSGCRGSRLRRGSMPPAPWKPTALAVGKEGAVLLGLQPLWNCGAGASPANATLNFHDCHPGPAKDLLFGVRGAPPFAVFAKGGKRFRAFRSGHLARS